MHDRVDGHTTHYPCGIVTTLVGHPSMAKLMKREKCDEAKPHRHSVRQLRRVNIHVGAAYQTVGGVPTKTRSRTASGSHWAFTQLISFPPRNARTISSAALVRISNNPSTE